jgi:hypothetical protein
MSRLALNAKAGVALFHRVFGNVRPEFADRLDAGAALVGHALPDLVEGGQRHSARVRQVRQLPR